MGSTDERAAAEAIRKGACEWIGQLDRILDPANDKVQLDTVFKAAHALGREVKLELV